MKKYAALMLLLCSCAMQAEEEISQNINRVCDRTKYSKLTEVVDCKEDYTRNVYNQYGLPFDNEQQIIFSMSRVLAEKVDNKTITEAESKLQLQSFIYQMNQQQELLEATRAQNQPSIGDQIRERHRRMAELQRANINTQYIQPPAPPPLILKAPANEEYKIKMPTKCTTKYMGYNNTLVTECLDPN